MLSTDLNVQICGVKARFWPKPQGKPFAHSECLRCGNSLAVQWLGVRASTAGAMGLIPGQGTKIPQAMQRDQKIK